MFFFVGICKSVVSRHQFVTVGADRSDHCDVLSGVPQGSVLGPLLFLVYINDIVKDLPPEAVEVLISLFCDDTKLAVPIRSQTSALNMQKVLDHLLYWSKKWSLPFNIDKCSVLHIGRDNQTFPYKMDGITLKRVEEMRDVGLLVDKSMKFSRHIAVQARRGHAVITQLTKAIHYRNHTFFQLYKTYVLPHLEFCSPAWSPHLQGDVVKLEKVQRRASRLVRGLETLPYEERLKRLRFHPLDKR